LKEQVTIGSLTGNATEQPMSAARQGVFLKHKTSHHQGGDYVGQWSDVVGIQRRKEIFLCNIET
jgi:hypothetical protein